MSDFSQVDEIVRKMIQKDPRSFRNRTDVLQEVFFAVPNGYKWNDSGEIQKISSTSNGNDVWTPEQEYEIINNSNFPDVVKEALMKTAEVRVHGCQTILSRLDDRVKHLKPLQVTEKHVSVNSLYATMPSNVSKDWMEASKELIGDIKIIIQDN